LGENDPRSAWADTRHPRRLRARPDPAETDRGLPTVPTQPEAREDAPQEWALLDQVLDGSPIGIVVLNSDLRLLRVSSRAEAMFGVDDKTHVGRRLESVLPEMFAEIRPILIDIIQGGAAHVGVETSAPKIGLPTPPRRYLAYYYPLVAEAAVIGVGCMFIDVTEQRTAEGALLDSEADRRSILGHMLRAEENQRSQLSLELHDDTIQVLCAVLLQLDGVIPLAERAGQAEIVTRLEHSREILAGATARARKLMFTLHPDALAERGLRAAITACARETGDEIGAEWTVDVPDDRYPWALEELAYRIVRKALTNVRKHSHAGRFSVQISELAGGLAGVVRDDGQGLADLDRTTRDPHHLGVEGMRERAHLAGGKLTVTSSQGHGVCVAFSLPAVAGD
jgi:signal transduction histidine kinase